MTPGIRYWLRRYRDGRIAALVRIREIPGQGLWADYFRMGEWCSDPSAVSYLMDPLLGNEISPEEAHAAVRELGQEWPDEPRGQEGHRMSGLELQKEEAERNNKDRSRGRDLGLDNGPEF